MADAAHVVVADVAAPELSSEDAHHLRSVLRLRDGEPVGATDGRGGYVPCVYRSGSRGLEVVGPVASAPSRVPALTVGFVPVKGDRPEWVVQKLTELGVDRVVVLSSERSVVRWDGPRWESHRARLERVARAAVMQSRQVWLPAIEGVVPVRSILVSELSAGSVAVADIGGGPLPAGVDTVLVGPEGGWSPEERAAASAGGRPVVGLGPAVLRAETAAVAAGALLSALREGLVGPAAV